VQTVQPPHPPEIPQGAFDTADDWGKPEDNGSIAIPHWIMRQIIREECPNRHLLYAAAWAEGYTVNGIRPD